MRQITAVNGSKMTAKMEMFYYRHTKRFRKADVVGVEYRTGKDHIQYKLSNI